MSGRRPLSKRTRFNVFKRDGFQCVYCGHHPPDVLLEVDHIMPVAEGGTDQEENLATSCCDCNRGKAAIPLSVVPQSLTDKAAEVAEREEQLTGYRAVMQARADRIENDKWEIAELLFPGCSEDGLSRDWLRGIKTLNERLPLHVVREAAEKALDRCFYSDRQRFLYFCKVCWNLIKREAE